jgi:hypothetical protein
LYAGRDPNKDQSYFLSHVRGCQFQNVIFPLGHLKKETDGIDEKQLLSIVLLSKACIILVLIYMYIYRIIKHGVPLASKRHVYPKLKCIVLNMQHAEFFESVLIDHPTYI